MTGPGPLAGRRVVVTREELGQLGELLAARGAIAVHVPLIEVVEAADGGAGLHAELERLADYDWLVVTSPAGARRVGAAAGRAPTVRLAAVGAATARTLAERAGRPVDLVPDRQIGSALADEFGAFPPSRVLLAVGDRAPETVARRLIELGHSVTSVVAYRTVARAAEPAAVEGADALVLASGSAAETWVEQFGTAQPPTVVAIGPSTAAVATRLGLKVAGVAADHSLAGLVAELERRFTSSERSG